MTKLGLRVAVLVLVPLAVISCSAGPAGYPTAPPAPATAGAADVPMGPDAALRMLDDAESEVARALGAQSQQRGLGQGYAQPPPPPPPPVASAAPMTPPPPTSPPKASQVQVQPQQQPGGVPQDRRPSGWRREVGEQEAARLASDPCATACAALASMERAADHLCSIAGASDGRCASARERVKSASTRVHSSCPACGR